jgi:hypothetical protein
VGNSPTINGEVTSKKSGVKASMGTDMDKSECFKAFI